MQLFNKFTYRVVKEGKRLLPLFTETVCVAHVFWFMGKNVRLSIGHDKQRNNSKEGKILSWSMVLQVSPHVWSALLFLGHNEANTTMRGRREQRFTHNSGQGRGLGKNKAMSGMAQ